MARLGKANGMTRIEVLVVVLAGGLILSLLPPTLRHAGSEARSERCRANLAAIGKAMLVYANDYESTLPRAGGRNTNWGDVANWAARNRLQAFGLDARGQGGTATISSSLYLLVKYAEVAPQYFVCPDDTGTTEFVLPGNAQLPQGFEYIDAWDFGPEAYRHCSYAYHMPFGVYALKLTNEPDMPVAADRNPWIKSPAGQRTDRTRFRPDLPGAGGTAEQARQGNSLSHEGDGQNVLFLDGHVTFEERSYCGLDNDNIYLVSNDAMRGSPVGMVPVPGVVTVMSRRDSVLVHDPVPVTRTAPPAMNVDSTSLRQTAVVATLEDPLPEHKNAIWCATFQMAWDKFEQDIIGEPIQLPGAKELASRLNQGRFPTQNIEPQSYYAAVGFVKNGIIEEIQSQMKQRFPSEPVPTFDSRYRTFLDVIVAYAYLNVAVGFEHPYYDCEGAFRFQDSSGARTNVTAFGTQTIAPNQSSLRVRRQADVLYYQDAPSPEAGEFAVDLSSKTQPYQVVLACIPRGRTLGESVKALQEKIARFKHDPDYETLRQLRPIDTMIVPDVAYKLTHQFEELLNKRLGNPKWREFYFFEALQKVDFSLSRTGMVLKSEARLAATRGARAEVEKPRHLYFNRPFLICVQKREPGAQPFFLMWVDNTELLRLYGKSETP